MNIPATVKYSRSSDLTRVLLPEMVTEQLELVGEALSEEIPNQLNFIKDCKNPGMEFLLLIGARAHRLRQSGCELFADRASKRNPSQLGLVIDNTDIFVKQASALLSLLEGPIAEEVLSQVDRIIETSFYLGYYAGSNDSLAITERYTNLGYAAAVDKPQQGGLAKANAVEPLKILVCDMANHIYGTPNLSNTPKSMLAKAIDAILIDFSKHGDNKNIPSLIKFSARSPEATTLHSWLKAIKKPDNLKHQPKPSFVVVRQALNSAYSMQKIKKALNVNND